jgi:hypothetical protein
MLCHIVRVNWAVEMVDEFEPEFDALHEDVQTEILALSLVLEAFGPQAFAFDPRRKAILLVAGDKSGGGEKRFYRELIRKADERFDAHNARLKKERK